jgi:hypothetical protein
MDFIALKYLVQKVNVLIMYQGLKKMFAYISREEVQK